MARLFRGYPLIGIHRGLSRLAVSTHFLIMVLDFLFIPTEVDRILQRSRSRCDERGVLGMVSRRNEKQNGPLHKRMIFCWRRRRNEKPFMCLTKSACQHSDFGPGARESNLTVLHVFEKRSPGLRLRALAVPTWSARKCTPGAQYYIPITIKNKKIKQPLKHFPAIKFPSESIES